MADEYGAKTYARVDDPEIEVGDIATRSCDHFIYAMTARQASKPVLLDKTITMNYDQVKKFFGYAASCGENKLNIRHNRRFKAKFMEVNTQICDALIFLLIPILNLIVFNFLSKK